LVRLVPVGESLVEALASPAARRDPASKGAVLRGQLPGYLTRMGRSLLKAERITTAWPTASPADDCLPRGAWRSRRVYPAGWGNRETPIAADREQVDIAQARRICRRKSENRDVNGNPDKLLKIGGRKMMTNNPDKLMKTNDRERTRDEQSGLVNENERVIGIGQLLSR
jgi:hypothetical protein